MAKKIIAITAKKNYRDHCQFYYLVFQLIYAYDSTYKRNDHKSNYVDFTVLIYKVTTSSGRS